MVAGWAHAQGSISNIQVEERADDLRVVDISFDLAGGGAEYNLFLEVSFNGEEFEAIDPDNITGSVSNVAPATNIQLVWDGSINFQNVSVNDAMIKITATHVCETDFTFTYRDSSVTYGTVLVDYSGTVGKKCWLDRNLGAPDVITEAGSNGDLFQWGRKDDGHQDPNSDTTPGPTNDSSPGDNFITLTNEQLVPGNWYDGSDPDPNVLWKSDGTGINNPCPSGWRLPTKQELEAETDTWDFDNDGPFGSPLKWSIGSNDNPGTRESDGDLFNFSSSRVWSSSISDTGQGSWAIAFGSTQVKFYSYIRSLGQSVRCVRDLD